MHWIYLIHEFHNLSWITEINELFHDILIYWDAPVYTVQCQHAIGQTYFQSIPQAIMKTEGKRSQNLDILGNLEIPARSCPGKRGCIVTLEMSPLKVNGNQHLWIVLRLIALQLRVLGVKSQRSSPFASCILANVNKSELLQMLTSAFRLFFFLFYKCLLLFCNGVLI